MVDNDPKKHMYDTSSPYHLINNYNFLGQTPLYVAAKYGHLDVIKFLLSRGADASVWSVRGKGEKESCLEVSSRWSHVFVVYYLLFEGGLEWSREEVYLSY